MSVFSWIRGLFLKRERDLVHQFLDETMKKGKYTVIGGNFDTSGNHLATQAREGKIDSELEK